VQQQQKTSSILSIHRSQEKWNETWRWFRLLALLGDLGYYIFLLCLEKCIYIPSSKPPFFHFILRLENRWCICCLCWWTSWLSEMVPLLCMSKKNTLEFENPPFFLPINHISCVLLACWSWVLWHFGCGTSIACIPKKHTKYNVVLENPFPPSINHSSYCLLVGWAAFGNWWHLRIDLS